MAPLLSGCANVNWLLTMVDEWTLSLINHDFYPYRPGQYALVCIDDDSDILCAYTLSSTPG
ncbi:MAG: hypothetical protein ACR5LD_11940, partial [Symbiopectobacterium sp.]